MFQLGLRESLRYVCGALDNPWMTAKSLACKAGRVLGTLLAKRVLGNRPVTLVGYSLGSLVVFEALQYLASLPPGETIGLVQDIYIFGAPVSVQTSSWTSARRVVAGRLVNGYSRNDYVLAILARLSDVKWNVAGLQPVCVQGVEDVECTDVDGHLKWQTMVGRSLQLCETPGVVDSEVRKQVETQTEAIEQETDMEMTEQAAKRIVERGPDACPSGRFGHLDQEDGGALVMQASGHPP